MAQKEKVATLNAKTCEQYVLQELQHTKQELEEMKRQNASLKEELDLLNDTYNEFCKLGYKMSKGIVINEGDVVPSIEIFGQKGYFTHDEFQSEAIQAFVKLVEHFNVLVEREEE